MKTALLALLLLAGSTAMAAETFRVVSEDGKTTLVAIVLRESSCVDKDVLEYLHDNVLDASRFKKADLEWEGENFGACWVDVGSYVFTVGSDKKPIRPPIPRAAFKDGGI